MDGTVDLDALEAYLSSDESPDDCMDLSELDGFLAGLIVGPVDRRESQHQKTSAGADFILTYFAVEAARLLRASV